MYLKYLRQVNIRQNFIQKLDQYYKLSQFTKNGFTALRRGVYRECWKEGEKPGRVWTGNGQEVGRKCGETEQDGGVMQGGRRMSDIPRLLVLVFKKTIKNH